MLAALLCNQPDLSQHGTAQVRKPAATSWNPNWAKQYGPEARDAKEDKEAVKEAIEAFKAAEYVPPQLEEIKEIVHKRSLVDELNDYKPDTDYYLVYLMEAYFYFCDWRKKDDEAIAIALLMME